MATIKQYVTYKPYLGFDTTNLFNVYVDLSSFYRYEEYYDDFITIANQKIKHYQFTDFRIICRIEFDEANLAKFQDFLGECADFELEPLTINEALDLAKIFSPARTVKNETMVSKTFSEYVNTDGVLVQTIS